MSDGLLIALLTCLGGGYLLTRNNKYSFFLTIFMSRTYIQAYPIIFIFAK